jgi:hypothetical protein
MTPDFISVTMATPSNLWLGAIAIASNGHSLSGSVTLQGFDHTNGHR